MTTTPARFENGPAFHMAGLNMTYTSKTMNDIPAQWDRIQPFLGKTPSQIGRVAYGVCHNLSGTGFDYFTGVAVSDAAQPPKELTMLEIPAQKYAVFPHAGPIAAIHFTIDAAWTWVKTSAQPADQPMHLEVYGPDWTPAKEDGLEIWVPMKS